MVELSGLRAGAAKVDITPPLHVPFLGFHPQRQGTFEGVNDRLWARAAVFATADTAVAILSADALGISTDLLGPGRDFIAYVREQSARHTDLEPHQILICATHAHSTPETYGITRIWEREDCADWVHTWGQQLADAVVRAWSDLRPACLRTGSADVSGLSRNRRERLGPGPSSSSLDEGATVLLVEREGGPDIVVANAVCHPVTVQVQPLVSADFPGAATALVERALGDGACCLFLQGAAGNINPVRNATREWRDVTTYGLMLGGAILLASGRARLASVDGEPVVGAVTDVLRVRAREAPDEQSAAAAADCADTAFRELGQEHPDYSERLHELCAAKEAYSLAKFGRGPIAAEVQALRIGDTAVVAFPGELFCELGLRAQADCHAPVTMVAELSNGCLGYLASEDAWAKGGYEVGPGAWSRVASGEAERLVSCAVRAANGLFSD